MNRKDIDNARCIYHSDDLYPPKAPLGTAEKALLVAMGISTVLAIICIGVTL